MSHPHLTLGLLVVTVALQPLTPAAGAPIGDPLVAFAIDLGGEVLVVWSRVPGAQEYVIYGALGGSLIELDRVAGSEMHAYVDDSYEEYSVAAVQGGHAGTPTTAMSPCARIEEGPPPQVDPEDCPSMG